VESCKFKGCGVVQMSMLQEQVIVQISADTRVGHHRARIIFNTDAMDRN
jgi:hypothetical protein